MRLIGPWEARGIVSWLDAGALAAAVWRLALADEDGKDRKAGAGIDLVYGRVWMRSWPADQPMPEDPNVPLLVLASCDSPQREQTWRSLSQGIEVPPSEDVVAAEVQDRARREGISWRNVERQLERIYGESRAA